MAHSLFKKKKRKKKLLHFTTILILLLIKKIHFKQKRQKNNIIIPHQFCSTIKPNCSIFINKIQKTKKKIIKKQKGTTTKMTARNLFILLREIILHHSRFYLGKENKMKRGFYSHSFIIPSFKTINKKEEEEEYVYVSILHRFS